MDVGDPVLVMPSFTDYIAIPLSAPGVGDSVMIYTLGGDIKLAVPVLSFDIGSYLFVSPEFDFAGFDWKVDFDFNLIPLMLNFTLAPSGTYYLDAIIDSATTYSPDYLSNVLGAPNDAITQIGQGGWFTASFNIPEGTMIPANSSIQIREKTTAWRIWTITSPHNYTSTPWISPRTTATEVYSVWVILPNKIKILCDCTHNIAPGNIDYVALIVP